MADGSSAPIVVGVDGSEVRAAALHWAAGQAARRGCALEVVTVSAATDRATRQAAGVVEAVAATYPSVHVRHFRLAGAAAPTLVRLARGAAMLVLGDRGTGRVARAMFGSVSAYCAAHATCPVVIVPDRADVSGEDSVTTLGPPR